MKCLVCAAAWGVAALIGGGCSILFSPGPAADAASVSCHEGVCRVTRTIGSAPGRDFPTISAWESAREGGLIDRRTLAVGSRAGEFEPGEVVTARDGSCSGLSVASSHGSSGGPVLFLDDVAGACDVGLQLVGQNSGAIATVQEILGNGTMEEGVLFADEPFDENVQIEGSITDSEHFMRLTVARGRRHNGIAGRGAIIQPEPAGHGIEILDDHAHIEWVEVTEWSTGASGSYDGIRIAADAVVVDYALVHHDGGVDGPDANGIHVEQGGVRALVRNSMVYNVSRAGIWADSNAEGVELEVVASSAFRCVMDDNNPSAYGCIGAGGGPGTTVTAINTVAANDSGSSSSAEAFQIGNEGVWGASSRNNLSSDNSAPGENSVRSQAAEEIFRKTDASPDLHLATGSPALESGDNLSDGADVLSVDIDEELRPGSGPWAVGADSP